MDISDTQDEDNKSFKNSLVYRDYESPYRDSNNGVCLLNGSTYHQHDDRVYSESNCDNMDLKDKNGCYGFNNECSSEDTLMKCESIDCSDDESLESENREMTLGEVSSLYTSQRSYSHTVSDSELTSLRQERQRHMQESPFKSPSKEKTFSGKKNANGNDTSTVYGSINDNRERLATSDTEQPRVQKKRTRRHVRRTRHHQHNRSYPMLTLIDTSSTSGLVSEFSEIQTAKRFSHYRALKRAVSQPAPIHSQDTQPSHQNNLNSFSGARHIVDDISRDPESGDSSESSEEVSFTSSLNRKDLMVLISLALTDLGSYMCLSILAPFFPKEAADKGVSNTISGWIFGIFALVQFITSPIFGKLVPKIGSRFLFIAGQFFGGGCTILFGFLSHIDTSNSSTMFVIYCLVLRSFLALGCTASATASFAITAKCFPDHIATVFGILETFTGLGCVIGPALGGVLYEFGGFVMPFAVLGLFMIITVPINLCVLPAQDDGRTASGSSQLTHILKIVPIVVVLLSVIIGSLIWAILDPTLEPHFREFNLGASEVGLIFLLMSACYAICSPLWGWVADRVEDSSPLLIIGYIVAAVGLLLLGPCPLLGIANTLSINMVSLCILGVAVSLAVIPTFDKILYTAEKAGIQESLSMYGAVAGLWGSAYALGEFVGPSLGGWMVDTFGFPWTMTYIAILCVATALVLMCLYVWECKQPTKSIKIQIDPDKDILVSNNDGDDRLRQSLLHTTRLQSLSEGSHTSEWSIIGEEGLVSEGSRESEESRYSEGSVVSEDTPLLA